MFLSSHCSVDYRFSRSFLATSILVITFGPLREFFPMVPTFDIPTEVKLLSHVLLLVWEADRNQCHSCWVAVILNFASFLSPSVVWRTRSDEVLLDGLIRDTPFFRSPLSAFQHVGGVALWFSRSRGGKKYIITEGFSSVTYRPIHPPWRRTCR